MGPTIAVVFGFSLLLIKLFFKKELKVEQKFEQQEDIQELMHRDENAILIHHKGLLIKSLIVLVGVIVLFSLQTITHLEVSYNSHWRSCSIINHKQSVTRKNLA